MKTNYEREVCPEMPKHNNLETFDGATYCGIIVNEPERYANTPLALTCVLKGSAQHG